MWGLFIGALTITFGFAPGLLVCGGVSVGEAGLLVGLATWLAGLLLLPSTDPAPVLVVVGIFLGLPVGVIVSMPASVLPSESRAIGMGIFFTWLYVGHAVLPPIGGGLQDVK